MICPRCGTAMEQALNGAYQCPECWASSNPNAPRPNLGPLPRGGLLPSPPSAEAFRHLQERVARLESAVEDLRRRLETDEQQRLRKVREALAEAGLLPDSAADGARCHRFLGETTEEPRPGEPGETR